MTERCQPTGNTQKTFNIMRPAAFIIDIVLRTFLKSNLSLHLLNESELYLSIFIRPAKVI